MREFFVRINYNGATAQSGGATFKFAIKYMLSPSRANNPFKVLLLCIHISETYETNNRRRVCSSAYTCEGTMDGRSFRNGK